MIMMFYIFGPVLDIFRQLKGQFDSLKIGQNPILGFLLSVISVVGSTAQKWIAISKVVLKITVYFKHLSAI